MVFRIVPYIFFIENLYKKIKKSINLGNFI